MRIRASVFDSSFVRGMAQAVDIRGSIASSRLWRFRAKRGDTQNVLSRDWRVIRGDLRRAMNKFNLSNGRF